MAISFKYTTRLSTEYVNISCNNRQWPEITNPPPKPSFPKLTTKKPLPSSKISTILPIINGPLNIQIFKTTILPTSTTTNTTTNTTNQPKIEKKVCDEYCNKLGF